MTVNNILGIPVSDNIDCLPSSPAKKYLLKLYANECNTDRLIVFEEEFDVDTVVTASPLTGATIAATTSTHDVTTVLTPAGTIATLTVTMPASPFNGQRFLLTSTQIVTALTLAGGTIVGATTALAVNTAVEYVYVLATTSWYKIK